jgi:hypothetical protein
MEAASTAAVEGASTTAVEAAASAIVAAPAEVASATEVSSATAVIPASAIVTSSAIVAPSVITASITVSVESASIVAMEPGTGTDEDAASEPIRPVVAVRRTGIRGIAVIAVRANWSHTVALVNRPANTYANGNALCARERCAEHANKQQTCNS